MRTKVITITILAAISHFRLNDCTLSSESDEEAFLASPIELTDQNFSETIKSDNILVLFLWPTLVSQGIVETICLLSEIYNIGNNTNLKIAFMDCDENVQTCIDNEVIKERIDDQNFEGYVLKLLKINEVKTITYEDDRTYLHYILEFVKEHLELPENENSGQDVVELTDQNFKELTSNGSWFIDFYFPWCIHAKNLEPTWNKLPSVLDQNASANIGKVDCVEFRNSICAKYSINASPTILWLENGRQLNKYQGDRSLKILKNFIESKMASKNAFKPKLSV